MLIRTLVNSPPLTGELVITYANNMGWGAMGIAFIGALAMFGAIDRVRDEGNAHRRLTWLAIAGVVMGLCLWAAGTFALLGTSIPGILDVRHVAKWYAGIIAIIGCTVMVMVVVRGTHRIATALSGALLLSLTKFLATLAHLDGYVSHTVLHLSAEQLRASLPLVFGFTTIALLLTASAIRPGRHRVARQALAAGVISVALTGGHFALMAALHVYQPAETLTTIHSTVAPASALTTVFAVVGLSIIATGIGIIVDSRMGDLHRGIREKEQRYRAVIDTMHDALLVIDAQGMIIDCNPAAAHMFSTDHDTCSRMPFALLMGAPDQTLSFEHVLDGIGVRTDRVPVRGMLKRMDGEPFTAEVTVTPLEGAGQRFFSMLIRDLSAEEEAAAELHRMASALHQLDESVELLDVHGRLRYVNPAFERVVGLTAREVLGRRPEEFSIHEALGGKYDEMVAAIAGGIQWRGELKVSYAHKPMRVFDLLVSPIRDADGALGGWVVVRHDKTEQLAMEQQLRQSQKMESVGQLAAGIAHEINTPVQFVSDNLRFLRESFSDLMKPLGEIRRIIHDRPPGDALERIAAHAADADIDYLEGEIPRALDQSLEGMQRVADIVRAMKEFSHPSTERTPADLAKAIASTATVARNEWKYVADIVTDFDTDLPLVPCVLNEFNQVILNMIVNAAHAIADVVGDDDARRGTITIQTRRVGDMAEIRISDTGAGMPEEVRARVFDPFFTTKPVGKGTGQGLSLAWDVIVKRHGGTIGVQSTPGHGACFVIRLPLRETTSEATAGQAVAAA